MARIGKRQRRSSASAREFKKGRVDKYEHAEGHVPFDEGAARRRLYEFQSETNKSWAARDYILDGVKLQERIQFLRHQVSGFEAIPNKQLDLEIAKQRLSASEHRKLNLDKIKSTVDRADQAVQAHFGSSLVAYTSSIEEALSNPDLAAWEGFIDRIAKLRRNNDVMTPLEHTDSAVLGGYFIQTTGQVTGLMRFGLKLLLQAEPDEDWPVQGNPELILRLSKLAREYQSLFPQKERTLVPGAFVPEHQRVKHEGLRIAWDLYKKIDDAPFHSLWFGNGREASPVFRYERGTLAYMHSNHKTRPFAVIRTPTRNVLKQDDLEGLISGGSLAADKFCTGTGIVFSGREEHIANVLFGLAAEGKLFPNGGMKTHALLGEGDGRRRSKHSEPRPWSVQYLKQHPVQPSGQEFDCVIADGCRYVVFPYGQLGIAIMEPPMTNAGTYVIDDKYIDAVALLDRGSIRRLGDQVGFMQRIEHKNNPPTYWPKRIDKVLSQKS